MKARWAEVENDILSQLIDETIITLSTRGERCGKKYVKKK